jgi:signal transduction histidine kinase
MRAPLPANEQQRLSVLRQFQILDTLPEPEFDELTQLASQICQTPIALISLVDAERQWFKSRVGIDASETHRDLAFCAHAILEDQPLVVPNATKDERFADNALVTSDPNIRLYMGAPLITSQGYPLGTLCVIDRVPRNLTAEQIHAVEVLAKQVVSQFELRSKMREMAELVTEVESVKTELQRSNRELEDFASVASHDLQEPLRKIQVFADRLKANYGGDLSEKGQDYLNRMQNAGSRMQRLITDLLTFSRVTTKMQPFREVDLARIAREVTSDLEIRLEETDGKLEIEELPSIEADSTQMRQLFQNLVGNALKFHRDGVPPVVRIRCEPDKGDATGSDASQGTPDAGRRYRISFEDNGIGFDETYAERIFAVFHRLHGRQEYDGTGVGLAVCKRIVERHHGTITARSKAGHGSTFTVLLPERQAGKAGASNGSTP